MTHQQVGQKSLVLPPARQCVFDGKEGRLGQRRLGQVGLAAVKDEGTQVGTAFEQGGGKGMAQGVGRNGLSDAGLNGVPAGCPPGAWSSERVCPLLGRPLFSADWMSVFSHG